MAEQTWSAERYQQNAAFVPAYGEDLIAWLEPKPGERILDLGCGDGALTVQMRDAGAEVIGVDSSPAMVDAARARGLDALVMNGEALTFKSEFDAVFSNAAMHWMLNARAVVEGVHRALRPKGRFVAELGGHGCVAAIQTALRAVVARRAVTFRAPWYFPTTDAYRRVLEDEGFSVERILLFPRPTPLPTGMHGWLETFARAILGDLDPADRAQAMQEAEDLLAPALRDERGRWTADYVRLRFIARRTS